MPIVTEVIYKLLVSCVYKFDLVWFTISVVDLTKRMRDRNCKHAVSCIAFIRRSRKVLHVWNFSCLHVPVLVCQWGGTPSALSLRSIDLIDSHKLLFVRMVTCLNRVSPVSRVLLINDNYRAAITTYVQ